MIFNQGLMFAGDGQERPQQNDFSQSCRGVRSEPGVAAAWPDDALVDRTDQPVHRLPAHPPGRDLHHLSCTLKLL
jgi:hypothetical protein